jgi:putative addiction module killer protein
VAGGGVREAALQDLIPLFLTPLFPVNLFLWVTMCYETSDLTPFFFFFLHFCIPRDTLIIMKPKYEIEVYEDSAGAAPFESWLLKLKDKRVQAKIQKRIDRAALGNFGDWKDIEGANGLFEMREHYGAGYRVFYSIVNRKIVLLLAGSSKKDQNRTIMKAKEYLADYKRRNNL